MQYYCKDSNCTQKVQFFHVSCTHIVHNILRSETTGSSGNHQCLSSKNAHGIVIIKLVNFSNDFSAFPFPTLAGGNPGGYLWSRTVYLEWLEMYSGTRRFMEATTAMSS